MDRQDRQDFGCLYRTVLAAPTVIPGHPYRHSRVSGIPTVLRQTSPFHPAAAGFPGKGEGKGMMARPPQQGRRSKPATSP